jgi:signal transduction histidine kinase
MPAPAPRRIRSPLVWPLLATVVLLILLLGGYAFTESRRLQRNLVRELEERAVALIGILEASSRNAIATQTMLEEVVAQRLLDNARFVDFIVGRTPFAQELIQRVVAEHRLAKVELLDLQGQPVALPQVETRGPGPWPERGFVGPGRRGSGASEDEGRSDDAAHGRAHGPMMRGMMRRPAAEGPKAPDNQRRPGMPFMWGQRWGGLRGDPTQLFPSLPRDAAIRRFWEGSAFGVAVPAQSFPGAIVVHADAEYLLNFRNQIGLQPLVRDLGTQPGVVAVSLLDRNLTVVASGDSATLDRKEDDAFLREVLKAGTAQSRRVDCGPECDTLEVVKPFALEQKQVGLIRLGLSTAGLVDVTRQAQRGILWYSLGLLAVGVAGAVAIFWIQARNLAERQRLEAAVAHEQRLAAMGNLAAGVAHEIKNPLNAISMGVQRLRMEFAPAETDARQEYTRFTRVIEGQVSRLNAIVNQFLTLARPLRLALADEPLAPVLKEVLTLLSAQAAAQGVTIVEDVRLGDARASLDRRQLIQAAMNVLLNAIQAMPAGGTLTVRADVVADSAATEGTARIAIADTGPGIPPENLDRIFEPYFTTKEGGTGLGLTLTRRIVQEHRGTIQAANNPEGGARFTIHLPLA